MNINVKKAFLIHKKIRCKQIEIENDRFERYFANGIFAKNFEIKYVKKYISRWDIRNILCDYMFYLYCPRMCISECDYWRNKHHKKCNDYMTYLNKDEYIPKITYHLFRTDK